MKQVNRKGFTLIELLAVITIMGILMIVAIPAVTRTIENSRKDTFIDTVKQYVNGAKNMWAADNLSCHAEDGNYYVSSSVPTGEYYIEVDSSDSSKPQLLEQGGKSPWGDRDMKGFIRVEVVDVTLAGEDGIDDTEDDVTTRKVSYYPIITDGVHGVNFRKDSMNVIIPLFSSEGLGKTADELVRGDIMMSGVSYVDISFTSICVES